MQKQKKQKKKNWGWTVRRRPDAHKAQQQLTDWAPLLSALHKCRRNKNARRGA